MLYKDISNDLILAMKNKMVDDKEVLSMLKSKMKDKAIEMRVEEIDDITASAIIQKFIKEMEDELAAFELAGRFDTANKLEKQLALVRTYLPKQLSEDEIRAEIAKLEDKSMPNVMKYFKTNFMGKVDMSLVSKIARGA